MNDFSVSTQIPSKIVNSEGVELFSFGSCPECEICKLAGKPSAECSKAHAKAGEDTLRFGGKYIYICPMGFVHAASPVLMEDSDIVTAIAGPILIIDRSDYFDEYIQSKKDLSDEKRSEIKKMLADIKVYPLEKVTSYSNMLYYLASYSSGKDAVKLLSTGEKLEQQSEISENIIHLKNGISDRTEYPLYKEKELLDVLSGGDRKTAQRLLNEILGYIFFFIS